MILAVRWGAQNIDLFGPASCSLGTPSKALLINMVLIWHPPRACRVRCAAVNPESPFFTSFFFACGPEADVPIRFMASMGKIGMPVMTPLVQRLLRRKTFASVAEITTNPSWKALRFPRAVAGSKTSLTSCTSNLRSGCKNICKMFVLKFASDSISEVLPPPPASSPSSSSPSSSSSPPSLMSSSSSCLRSSAAMPPFLSELRFLST